MFGIEKLRDSILILEDRVEELECTTRISHDEIIQLQKNYIETLEGVLVDRFWYTQHPYVIGDFRYEQFWAKIRLSKWDITICRWLGDRKWYIARLLGEIKTAEQYTKEFSKME